MNWEIEFFKDFESESEFDELDDAVQDECFAHLKVLAHFGPSLGRPHVDTLNGSKHANMKELRFKANGGVWRLTFAFDPKRRAILLICGDKAGKSSNRFYKDLIKKSDQRFDKHLKKSNNGVGK